MSRVMDAAGDYDLSELFAVASLRHARLKGPVSANRQRVSLPPGVRICPSHRQVHV